MKKGFLFSCIFFLAACSLLQPPAEATPTIGSPVETPAESTAAPEPSLPPVSTGVVTGRVCYPSEFIPVMTLYFRNVETLITFHFLNPENQDAYEIELPAGTYQAFGWQSEAGLGGGYTAYVACGFGEECTDHSLLEVPVEAGQTVSGIDICDWVLTDLQLPVSGPEGPEGSAAAYAGLIYRTSEALWQIDPSGDHRILLDRPDALVLSPERFVYAEGDDIWLYDASSGQSTNLTNTPDRIETLWSGVTHPDGALLFTSFPVDFEAGPGVTGFLTIVNLDGSDYRVLDDENQTWHFEVSPDAAQVAYGLGRTGLILDLASGERTEFTPAVYGLEEVESIGSPSWSPDGGRISWVVGFQPEEGQPFTFGLAVFDLQVGTARILHPHEIPGMDGYPPPAVWRPDGSWLAYTAFDADFSRGGIWLLNADGAGEIFLGQGGAPVWRPDGGGLVYLDSSNGFVRFYDAISLESSVVEFSDKSTQPVGWLP
jgi:hypothetical protein